MIFRYKQPVRGLPARPRVSWNLLPFSARNLFVIINSPAFSQMFCFYIWGITFMSARQCGLARQAPTPAEMPFIHAFNYANYAFLEE